MSIGRTLDHGGRMITWNGHKVTANQFGKLMVEDWGSRAREVDFTADQYTGDGMSEAMTERELEACGMAIDHQIERLRKLLNVRDLWDRFGC